MIAKSSCNTEYSHTNLPASWQAEQFLQYRPSVQTQIRHHTGILNSNISSSTAVKSVLYLSCMLPETEQVSVFKQKGFKIFST